VTSIVTLGTVVVGVAAGLILTAPNFAVMQIMVGLVVVAVVMPIVVYPISYTLWQACDLAMRPPQPGEFSPHADAPG
jgi:ABC-type spermidine/putrescine transport system permease subunit II